MDKGTRDQILNVEEGMSTLDDIEAALNHLRDILEEIRFAAVKKTP